MTTLAAKLKLEPVATSTPERREAVARWLEEQAESLRIDGERYSPNYRASHSFCSGSTDRV